MVCRSKERGEAAQSEIREEAQNEVQCTMDYLKLSGPGRMRIKFGIKR